MCFRLTQVTLQVYSGWSPPPGIREFKLWGKPSPYVTLKQHDDELLRNLYLDVHKGEVGLS
jgi:hypothetical protein